MIRRPTVITFGEVLLRLSPPGQERLLQSPELRTCFGGAEANVAVSLAQFGLGSRLLTCLPENAIGDAALRALRAEGVDVSFALRGGERVGIYFAETGAGQRASTVVYDRAHSSFSALEPTAVSWSSALAGAAWFHTTGITPALGPHAADCTRAALQAARAQGLSVSIDLNYRPALWSPEEAQRTLRPLMQYVDLLIANEDAFQAAVGVPVTPPALAAAGGPPEPLRYREAAERVVSELGVKQVAITRRESLSASENGWSAVFYDHASHKIYGTPRYLLRLVDRIGGGDSFAAGLIFAILDARPLEDGLRFALAASALKQTIPGDFNRVSVREVDRLAAGDASGRIQR